MINFCLTNEPKLVKGKWTNKKLFCKKEIKFGTPYATYYVYLYYDSGVEVIDLPRHVIVFCGILWKGEITDFLKNVKQNGIFYAIVINKVSGKVQVINDFMDSFYLNYYTRANQFVVTNDIQVYGSSFKINQNWVNWSNQGVNLMDSPSNPHPNLTIPEGNSRMKISSKQLKLQNITPIKDVKYLGAGDVLTLQARDDIDCQPVVTNWFTYHRDVGKLFFEKPKHDYKSALDTAKTIIRENCERIKEKFGTQLIHFCSTGVDSLVLQSYLDVPMYGFYSEQFNAYNESTELFEELYSNNGGTLHRFDSNKILNIINKQLDKLQKTIDYNPHHIMFMYMRDKFKLNDRVIIQGNSGDHAFWHDRYYVYRHAVHRWGMKDAEQIWDRCISHYGFGGPPGPTGFYSKQSRINEMNKYISKPCKDFATSMMQRRYFNRVPQTIGNYMPDQLMIDPYADLRLIKLLPTSDIPTQEASMLDVWLQKDMISDKLIPYLAPHKCGNYLFYDQNLNNASFSKKAINALVKNLQAST